ncbi:hypothetical protein, partial [Hydrotalea sp.]|uniref:hypothetical protein n=1 Tax=Hydrotalea sp. TaxID=2881279 RepID=UPI002631D03D
TTHISIGIPGICSARWDCNKETDDCELGPVKIKYSEDLNTGNYSAHAELGYSKSFGQKKNGIFAGEISAGGGGFVEWTNNGITDAGVIASASIDAGVDIGSEKDSNGKTTTIIGAETRIGINSGPVFTGQGILSSVTLK